MPHPDLSEEYAAAKAGDEVPFNYRYLVGLAKKIGGRVLDYGCGVGTAIAYGRSRGLDIWGADNFNGIYHQWTAGIRAGAEGRVRRIEGDAAPYDDRSFDCIFCNQVLEHVRDPGVIVADAYRLLRPGGTLIVALPVLETWYEGHVGLYFAHWLAAYPRLRLFYFDLCYRCGLGLYRENDSRRVWVTSFARLLDDVCFYRRERDIVALIEGIFGAPTRDLAVDYMRARLGPRARLAPAWSDPLLRFVYRKRAGTILAVRRPVS